MFAPLRTRGAEALRPASWPTIEDLQRALGHCPTTPRSHSGARISFVPQSRKTAVFEQRYEHRIYLKGEVQVREGSWHDLMNALVWLAYPRAKAALNARHYQALRDRREPGLANRGPLQDALTLFDEGGVIVVARDPGLLQLVRSFQWKKLFWEARARAIANMRFYLFGHALYEKALKPFTGITARGVLFEVESSLMDAPLEAQVERADAMAAAFISDAAALRCPHDLSPVPILGVPGWCAENERETYYENRDYFRAGRKQR